MTIEMPSKTKVKHLIASLLEMPMESTVEICVRDKDGNPNFADVYCVYTDEYNGKKSVVISSK